MDFPVGFSEGSSRKEVILGLESVLQKLSDYKSQISDTQSGPTLESLLRCITPRVVGFLTQKEQETLLLKCFTTPNPAVTITSFGNALSSKDGIPQTGLSKALWILDAFLSLRLTKLFSHFTEVDSASVSEQRKAQAVGVVQDLVSLPEKIGNRCYSNEADSYQSKRYLCFISKAIISSLSSANSRLTANRATDLTFTADVIKRFNVAGYGEEILNEVILFLGARFNKDDYVWPRIAQRIFVQSDWRSGEGLVVAVLSKCRISDVRYFLGDSSQSRPMITHLLTSKLLFQKIFDRKLRIPTKIAHYLYGAGNEKLFDKTFLNLLDIWSDKGSILHSDTVQRRYICQAVGEFCTFLTEEDASRLKAQATEKMLRGMSVHLESPLPEIRIHGMAIGEKLSEIFGSGEKLEFDYDRESFEAKLLLRYNDDVGSAEIEKSVRDLEVIDPAEEKPFRESQVALDSDDDEFEAYEMPESEKNVSAGSSEKSKKPKPPVFIRDCLHQLSEQKEPLVFDAAFNVTESLIRKGAFGFSEVVADLTKLVLSLEDRFSTENFEEKRKNILIACCVKEPEIVVRFLSHEVFSRHYTMGQRVLMLNTIREAANELSELKTPTKAPQEVRKISTDKNARRKEEEDVPAWKAEVNARIAAKTRRFSDRPEKPSGPVPSRNRFTSIAGMFFHPLLTLYQSSNQAWLDLMGRDYFLLGKLLFTLGAIVRCSENSPSLLGLLQSLFLVVLELRFHPEPFVRQGLLYCVTMGFSVITPGLEDPALKNSVSDICQWLMPMAENEMECQPCIMRTPPKYTTLRIETDRMPLEKAVSSIRSQLQSESTRFENLSITEHPTLKNLVMIKGSGPHQPAPKPIHIYVDRLCGAAVMRGAHIYAPGILASSVSGFDEEDEVSVWMDLNQKCLRGMVTELASQDRVFLGNGKLKISRHNLYSLPQSKLKGIGVEITDPVWLLPSLDSFSNTDWAFPINLPSFACVASLKLEPGHLVLDMCAAPGGKTLAIASRLNEKGKVLALDKNHTRLKALQKRVSDLAVTNIECFCFDGVKSSTPESIDPGSLRPPFGPATFDRILLDAPCSARGQRPIRPSPTHSQLDSYSDLQRALIDNAVKLLKPGGILVYSTCTTNEQENHSNIVYLLDRWKTMKLLSEKQYQPRKFCPRHPEGDCDSVTESADLYASAGSSDPSELSPEEDTIGFFIASFEKLIPPPGASPDD